jgi:outer membrane protein OmpA-like peptidoglycan-associated protein
MANPAGTNGASSAELNELRQLIIGPELQQLATVQERLDDPVQRAADLAQVLPEAVKGAKAKALREALEPMIERAFTSTVRKHPRELADVIYPVMGPAIRNSIAAAIREFAEGLNQIVEKSISFRAIKWRCEALITGKPFSQILLARSLLYSVEQVFLIHRKSGLLLQHAAAQGSVLKDADMISGMLTAIQDFLSDSFTEGGQELDTVDTGRFRLWMTYSSKVLLVAAVSGTAPAELRQVFRHALDQIEATLGNEIDQFRQDDTSVFEPARPMLEACLLGQSATGKTKQARLWPYVAAVAAILLLLAGWRVRELYRWNQYFGELKQQPGIVITDVERNGSNYVVEGLKDPAAPDPASLLGPRELDPKKVRFQLQPYLSLNTAFAAKRVLDADRETIGNATIRFDPGSSKLPLGEADRVGELARAVILLTNAEAGTRIVITGHADDTGSGDTNSKLSLDRANSVADALVVEGVTRELLMPEGVGNTQPLRPGITEWARATNRRVSFRAVNAGRR